MPDDLSPVVARIEPLVREHDRFLLEHPEYMILLHQARGVLQLRSSGLEQLRLAFRHYLGALCDVIVPPPLRSAHHPDDCLDAAAALAGAVAGYRSYCLAASCPVELTSLVAVATLGLAPLLHRR